MNRNQKPPRFFLHFFRWFCNPDYVEDIEGDLLERFEKRIAEGKPARSLFAIDVVKLFRPAIIKSLEGSKKLNYYDMLKHNFKIGYRNLLRQKAFSILNIGGLALGLTISILIALWVYDELTFNQNQENYDYVAQVLQRQSWNGNIRAGLAIPYPLGEELQTKYGSDFKYVVMSSWFGDYVISNEKKTLSKRGGFMDVDGPHLLSLKMLKGSRSGLADQKSILLSKTTANALFGDVDAMGQTVKIYNEISVVVKGIYQDMPHNSSFKGLSFIGTWDLYVAEQEWVKRARDKKIWDDNSFQLFVQVLDHSNMAEVSKKIKRAKYNNVNEADKVYNAEIFLHPMNDWHLRSQWEDGVQKGGQMKYVWLFGIIGAFVLILACINFMNLTTAQSERRAKEVGIRKSIGSSRVQLIFQFLSESITVVFSAFLLSIAIVSLVIPFFNEIANKQIVIPFNNFNFWLLGLAFILTTGFLAGSYPAIYLSSFRPVQVLKGTFKTGLSAVIFRKSLVVFQFVVSVVLIIGSIAVQQQVEHASNRPIGYDENGTIMIEMTTEDHYDKFSILKNELTERNIIDHMALSSSPLTEIWNERNGLSWDGMNPDFTPIFPIYWVTHDFGKTIDWQLVAGRDFSLDYASDSTALILNESAVNYMGLDDPVGKTVRWLSKDFRIIGVVKDILIESPFEPTRQTIYLIDPDEMANWMILKLNPGLSTSQSLTALRETFETNLPNVPFEFDFASEEHARKFDAINRIGNLSNIFAILAMLISSLGLFGLASFMVEQRTKEIGIRKVLGASVKGLWQMLSIEFMLLVSISCLIAVPIAYFTLSNWLQNYEYRTELHWWIFMFSCAGALLMTLVMVSFQSLKAAAANPVEALRSE